MKRGTNCIFRVSFKDIDFDTVEKIEFIFKQHGRIKKEFTYPSETAYRSQKRENEIELIWTQEETFKFFAAKVGMDTRITLKGSFQNPKTDIKYFNMDETLFDEVDEQ